MIDTLSRYFSVPLKMCMHMIIGRVVVVKANKNNQTQQSISLCRVSVVVGREDKCYYPSRSLYITAALSTFITLYTCRFWKLNLPSEKPQLIWSWMSIMVFPDNLSDNRTKWILRVMAMVYFRYLLYLEESSSTLKQDWTYKSKRIAQ